MCHSSLRTALLRFLFISTFISILLTPVCRAQVSFDADRVYPLSATGGPVAVGDVNRDGFLDICVGAAADDPTSMAILLGDGSGGFRHARMTPTDFIRPTVLRFVDVNQDGKLDLVCVDEAQGRFGVLVGNGRGKFTQGPSFSLNEVVTNTLFGDFDGDGLTDVAFHVRTSHHVVIWRGDVDESFVPDAIVPLAWHSAMVASADFDGDGDLDLVVTVPEYQGYLQTLVNDGTGNFTPGIGVAVSPYPEVIATGDFNGDGAMDAVVAHNGVSQIWLLNGDGHGRLNFGQIFVGIAIALSLVDLDGDGNPEILAVVPDGVVVYHARGGGSYDYGIFVAGGGNRGVEVGDFDGDGDQDLVLETGFPRVHRYSTGEQTGQAEIQVRELATAELSLNLDGDDYVDLVTADARAGSIVVRHGTASGGFGTPTVYSGGTISDRAYLVSADLDGDGRLDLVLATAPISPTGLGAATIALNDGSGGLVIGQSLTYEGAVIGVGVADVGGDRVPDVIVAHGFSQNASNPGYVDFYGGNGDGTFSSPGRLTLPTAAVAMTFGDWNEDGRPDMVYRDSVRRIPAETRVHVLLRGPTGFVDAASYTFPIGEFFDLVTPGDVNGDGHTDLVFSGGQIGLRVAIGDGYGNFAVQPVLDDDTSTVAVAIGDFDTDGAPDIAALSGRFYRVGVFLGDEGEFHRAPVYFRHRSEPLLPRPNRRSTGGSRRRALRALRVARRTQRLHAHSASHETRFVRATDAARGRPAGVRLEQSRCARDSRTRDDRVAAGADHSPSNPDGAPALGDLHTSGPRARRRFFGDDSLERDQRGDRVASLTRPDPEMSDFMNAGGITTRSMS
ncbi:MAG: VCBS repeat-containing protein [Planctomycetes bacterium]|nr:VCBS repeat-containing protein [Planctomycetota bacterium]